MSDLEPIDQTAATLVAVGRQISAASSVEEIKDTRARLDAARAAARHYGQLKQIRIDLLRLEVKALVRVAQLGQVDQLPKKDQEAARWLAGLSDSDREKFVAQSHHATTAVGMCKTIWRENEIHHKQKQLHDAGIRIATTPEPPQHAYDGDVIESARDRVVGLGSALAELLDHYSEVGQPYTIEELGDHLLDYAANGYWIRDDSALVGAVRHVVRQAVSAAPFLTLDGTNIPRTLTVRLDDGKYVRIPTENGLVAHVDNMIEVRDEQLEAYKHAVDELRHFRQTLGEIEGCAPDARIGDLIGVSVRSPEPDPES